MVIPLTPLTMEEKEWGGGYDRTRKAKTEKWEIEGLWKSAENTRAEAEGEDARKQNLTRKHTRDPSALQSRIYPCMIVSGRIQNCDCAFVHRFKKSRRKEVQPAADSPRMMSLINISTVAITTSPV